MQLASPWKVRFGVFVASFVQNTVLENMYCVLCIGMASPVSGAGDSALCAMRYEYQVLGTTGSGTPYCAVVLLRNVLSFYVDWHAPVPNRKQRQQNITFFGPLLKPTVVSTGDSSPKKSGGFEE
jgi:hypothetical protein